MGDEKHGEFLGFEARGRAFTALHLLSTEAVKVLDGMIAGTIVVPPAVRLAACQTVLKAIGILPVPCLAMACGCAVGDSVEDRETLDEIDFDEVIRRSAEDTP